jgi:hypothetical protein
MTGVRYATVFGGEKVHIRRTTKPNTSRCGIRLLEQDYPGRHARLCANCQEAKR